MERTTFCYGPECQLIRYGSDEVGWIERGAAADVWRLNGATHTAQVGPQRGREPFALWLKAEDGVVRQVHFVGAAPRELRLAATLLGKSLPGRQLDELIGVLSSNNDRARRILCGLASKRDGLSLVTALRDALATEIEQHRLLERVA